MTNRPSVRSLLFWPACPRDRVDFGVILSTANLYDEYIIIVKAVGRTMTAPRVVTIERLLVLFFVRKLQFRFRPSLL